MSRQVLVHSICVIGLVICLPVVTGCNEKKQPTPSAVGNLSSEPVFLAIEHSKNAEKLNLENVFRLSERLYSGGEPKNDMAFRDIAKLGCTTIVSVDGARPKLELASKHGLRYVHIPIGYDGLNREAQLAIVNVIRTCEGPIFFHCHHGKHRGPAAAAIGLIAETDCDPEVALKFLQAVGTSRDYAGLWRDVANFELPSADVELPRLSSIAEIDSLIASMSNLDRAFDDLKLCRKVDWQTPDDHPDLVPLSLATLVREAFAESRRLAHEDQSEEFLDWLATSEKQAEQLELGFRVKQRELIESAFESLSRGCQQCHAKYRN